MALDRVTVNGNHYSWPSMGFKIDGNPVIGMRSVKYNDKLEKAKAYGAGKSYAPRGKTRGKYVAEASLSVLKDSAYAIRSYLARKGGGVSYGNVVFQATVEFYESELGLSKVELKGCTYGGTDDSVEENPDPSQEDIALDVITITRNGLTLYDSSGGGSGLLGLASGLVNTLGNLL